MVYENCFVSSPISLARVSSTLWAFGTGTFTTDTNAELSFLLHVFLYDPDFLLRKTKYLIVYFCYLAEFILHAKK